MKYTKDLLFVAWLEATKEESFVEFNMTNQDKKIATFTFNIESEKWNDYKKEFYKCETTKTRYAVQRIKDLMN